MFAFSKNQLFDIMKLFNKVNIYLKSKIVKIITNSLSELKKESSKIKTYVIIEIPVFFFGKFMK